MLSVFEINTSMCSSKTDFPKEIVLSDIPKRTIKMLPHFYFCQYLENGYFSMRYQSVGPYADWERGGKHSSCTWLFEASSCVITNGSTWIVPHCPVRKLETVTSHHQLLSLCDKSFYSL